MISNPEIPKEYSKSISAVIHFIQNNLNENLSLEKLSRIANYSPFHFQRIFKQVTGESPRQYIARTRLETAAHSLIIQSDKPVKEIAIEAGFTSAATFARAFKSYFGVSAERLRAMPVEERMAQYKKGGHGQQLLDTDKHFKNVEYNVNEMEKILHIEVKKIAAMAGVYRSSALEVADIENAYRKIFQSADANDLLEQGSRFIGVIYPHQLSYKALISVKRRPPSTGTFLIHEIPNAKYATYKIVGDLQETFQTLKIFTEIWLPESGYRLADIWGFEILSENPATKSYSLIEREMHIPIIPK
jgi:AraC family transcriptional regulator